MKKSVPYRKSKSDQVRDAAFIRAVDNWPFRYVLPVKSWPRFEGEYPQFATVWQHDPKTVYLLPIGKVQPTTDLNSVPRKTYNSVEELVEEWRVD